MNDLLLSEVEILLTLSAPSSPPSDHTHIPSEILHHIASFLDAPSTLSFALVARAFTLPAESAIWHDLDFFSLPVLDHSLEKYYRDSGGAVGENHGRMRDRVQKTLIAGNKRRWKMVKSLCLTYLPHCGDWMVILLEMCMPSVVSLRLTSAGPDIDDEGAETLDMRIVKLRWDLLLCGRNLSLPSLTHVRFDQNTIQSITFIHLLCQCAPNLTHLYVAVHERYDSDAYDHMYLNSDSQNFETTRIRECSVHLGVQDIFSSSLHYRTTIDLLRNSPALEKLGIALQSDHYLYDDSTEVVRCARGLKALRQLHWGNNAYLPTQTVESGVRVTGFENLNAVCMMYMQYGLPVSFLSRPAWSRADPLRMGSHERGTTCPSCLKWKLFISTARGGMKGIWTPKSPFNYIQHPILTQ